MILLDEIEKPPIVDIRPPSYHATPSVWDTSTQTPLPASPLLLPATAPLGRSLSPPSLGFQSQFRLAPPVHPLRTLTHTRSASSLATYATPGSGSSAINNTKPHNGTSSDMYPYATPSLSSSTLTFPSFSYRSNPVSLATSIGHSSPSSTPPNIQPSNSLYIARENTSIAGQYIIDTALYVPECLLPKLAKVEKRRTLKLVTGVGDVVADVWVCEGWAERRVLSDAVATSTASLSTLVGYHSRVPSSSSGTFMDENGILNNKNETRHSFDTDSSASHFNSGTAESAPEASCSSQISERRCADIEMRTTQGSISLTVQTLSPHRLRISAHTLRGSIHIRIPRTFRGVLRLIPDTSEVEFSIGILETLKELVVPTDDGVMRKSRAWSVGGEEEWWQRPRLERDEVNVECGNGSVLVAFTDETASDIPKNHDLIAKILTKARRSRGTY